MTFGEFSTMLGNLPAEAVIRALTLECEVLEERMEDDRSTLDADAFSVVCFRQFIQMARRGEVFRCAKCLPPDHLEFYRETVFRLVQANELRASAIEQFEHAFRPIL